MAQRACYWFCHVVVVQAVETVRNSPGHQDSWDLDSGAASLMISHQDSMHYLASLDYVVEATNDPMDLLRSVKIYTIIVKINIKIYHLSWVFKAQHRIMNIASLTRIRRDALMCVLVDSFSLDIAHSRVDGLDFIAVDAS